MENLVNVIYKSPFDDFLFRRDIRLSVEWDDRIHVAFAVIPDELLEGILETGGWCELELSGDGKTVVGFMPVEIPDYAKPKPTQEERIAELEEALEMLLSGVTE